jgi:hypothetical protein
MNNYPLFLNEYLTIDTNEDNTKFNSYLSFTDKIVTDVQKNNSNRSELYLSFYPIAKNIRMTTSQMVVNILDGKSSYIENRVRDGEENFWRNYKKMGDWYPWLWARGRMNGNFKNIDGWKYYFKSFQEQLEQITNQDEVIKPPDNLMLFFTYLSCSMYVFQLNDVYNDIMLNYSNTMNWPIDTKILAVQIRRGETCTKDGSIADRPFFHLNKYIENIEKLLSHNNYEYIYISTDSSEEIGEIKRLRPEWKLLYLPIDRTRFFRMNEKPVDLEVFCCLEPERIPFIVDSGLADLYFISRCQGYISTISNSEFSRLGWYLQIAKQRQITPYINMNEETLNMAERDKLLLL